MLIGISKVLRRGWFKFWRTKGKDYKPISNLPKLYIANKYKDYQSKLNPVKTNTHTDFQVIRSHGLKLLSMLFETSESNMSILEYDAFGLLVALTFSVPSLFNGDQAAPLPSGNIQDAHILRLVYIVHLVQILLTTDRFSNDQSSKDSESTQTDSSMEDQVNQTSNQVYYNTR